MMMTTTMSPQQQQHLQPGLHQAAAPLQQQEGGVGQQGGVGLEQLLVVVRVPRTLPPDRLSTGRRSCRKRLRCD